MGCSVISHKDFRETLRFDAEYYKEEYLSVESKLESLKSSELNKIIAKLTNGVEIRDFIDSGIPYIKVSNTNKPFFIDFSNIAFVRKNSLKKLSKEIILLEGDVLTNRSGTLGYSQIITSDMRESIISSHNIRISGIKINPYYLVTFLNSKYGRLQILRRNNGGVVPEINQPALNSILIYSPKEKIQDKIEEQIKKAYSLFIESNKRISDAELIIENEMNIDSSKFKKLGTTIINRSDIISEERLDAQYFSSNKFKNIFDNKFEIILLKNLCEKIDTGLTPAKDSYWYKGHPVLKMGCLTNRGIDWSKVEFANAEYFKRAKKFLVLEKDIILTSSAHALEHIGKKVDIVSGIPKEYKNKIVFVGEVMRLRIKENSINPYYLTLFLRTKIGYRLLQNCIRGQTAHIYPKDIKKIPVPIIGKRDQSKVERLFLESQDLIQKSHEILQNSIREVEKLIEDDH